MTQPRLAERLRAALLEYDGSGDALLECLRSAEAPARVFAARLRFNRARTLRTTLLTAEVLPVLLRDGLPEERTLAEAIAQSLTRYDALYGAHIARWGLEQIELDWKTYCEESIALIEACRPSLQDEQMRVEVALNRIVPNDAGGA